MLKTDENLKYFISLNYFSKFGPARINRLEKYFSDAKSAFLSDLNQLVKAGIEGKIAEEFISERKKIVPDSIIEKLNNAGIKTVCLGDEIYPKMLCEIFDAPVLLYYRGTLKDSNKHSLAIVGSRKSTHYGKQAIEKIVPELISNNFTINSGLALGIDSLAHSEALKSTGRTVAVLGSGIDDKSIYPACNKNLALKIVENGGALISEFPPGTPPLRHHFPLRNRIVSGMSRGILVVEAATKSGALITARLGLEHNREVMAIPGNIFSPVSAGPNYLIKEGAKAINNASDIFECLNIDINSKENKKITQLLSEEEALIFKYLSHEPVHIDIITMQTKMPSSKISSVLTIMEIKGLVKNIGSMKYIANTNL